MSKITIKLKLAGQDQEIKTDNIYHALKELVVDPLKIKSVAMFEISYRGNTFRRRLVIPLFRALLVNDIRQQIFAKVANQSLGITGENLYV